MKNILAFEAGASATRGGLYDHKGRLLEEGEAGAANPIESGVRQCVRTLTALSTRLCRNHNGPIGTVAGGIAGAGHGELRDRIAATLCTALDCERAVITDDLRPLLLANAGHDAAVLVVAGTGSSVLAQAHDGQVILIGGRGPIIGDDGSAYRVAVTALRATADALDAMQTQTDLAGALAHGAGVAAFSELPRWAAAATKAQIAALAKVVMTHAQRGEPLARQCIESQAAHLTGLARQACRRLSLPDRTPVYINGGLFEHGTVFLEAFRDAFCAKAPEMAISFPKLRGHRAVFELAMRDALPDGVSVRTRSQSASNNLPPTEQHYLRKRSLDQMPAEEIVRAMNAEDQQVAEAVAEQTPTIAKAIEAVAAAFAARGRLIYAGAGTSGRLGILDASECPPTFGVPCGQVVALIAGGEPAIRKSVEGAEDDTGQALSDLATLEPQIGPADVVVGISASGTTPYVRAILDEAQTRHATPILVCCNPACVAEPQLVIAVDTGPEVLAGSTRLKAGTATKLVLNMISTGAMARTGLIFEGFMVGMNPINAKLRQRATRIVSALTGLDEPSAAELLEAAGNQIARAVLMARASIGPIEAEKRLSREGGNLGAALQRD